jgi:hypothetical protein
MARDNGDDRQFETKEERVWNPPPGNMTRPHGFENSESGRCAVEGCGREGSSRVHLDSGRGVGALLDHQPN